MRAITFFVVYYEANAADQVENVCDQLQEAIDGKRAIVVAPDGIMVEQFAVGEREEREEWEGG